MTNQSEVASEDATLEPKVRRISNKPSRKPVDGDPAAKDESAASSSDADSSHKTEQKRSNRRRRGKGKSGQKETVGLVPEELETRKEKKDKTDARDKPQDKRQQSQKSRRKIDPAKVAKNAWKIFLAEVSEEGVALIADNDARELARRCFRLSEIFLEEEDKRD